MVLRILIDNLFLNFLLTQSIVEPTELLVNNVFPQGYILRTTYAYRETQNKNVPIQLSYGIERNAIP